MSITITHCTGPEYIGTARENLWKARYQSDTSSMGVTLYDDTETKAIARLHRQLVRDGITLAEAMDDVVDPDFGKRDELEFAAMIDDEQTPEEYDAGMSALYETYSSPMESFAG